MNMLLWAILAVQVAKLSVVIASFLAARYDRQVDEARQREDEVKKRIIAEYEADLYKGGSNGKHIRIS